VLTINGDVKRRRQQATGGLAAQVVWGSPVSHLALFYFIPSILLPMLPLSVWLFTSVDCRNLSDLCPTN